MTLFREQLERIAVPPNAADGLADHCTIDRKFLSELAALALRGLDATETAQGALVILNVHKLEKAKSYDEGFKAGFAALEAKRMKMVPVEREFICKKCGLRIDSNAKPVDPYF